MCLLGLPKGGGWEGDVGTRGLFRCDKTKESTKSGSRKPRAPRYGGSPGNPEFGGRRRPECSRTGQLERWDPPLSGTLGLGVNPLLRGPVGASVPVSVKESAEFSLDPTVEYRH